MKKPTPEELKALAMIDWEPAIDNGNKWYDRMVAAMRLKDRAAREKEFDKIEEDLKALKKDAVGQGRPPGRCRPRARTPARSRQGDRRHPPGPAHAGRPQGAECARPLRADRAQPSHRLRPGRVPCRHRPLPRQTRRPRAQVPRRGARRPLHRQAAPSTGRRRRATCSTASAPTARTTTAAGRTTSPPATTRASRCRCRPSGEDR